MMYRTCPPNGRLKKERNANHIGHLVDTIGNFALLSQSTNQKADNLSFLQKKDLYFANGSPEYALTSDIEDKVAWTPDVTRSRTESLSKIMENAWQLNRAMLSQ